MVSVKEGELKTIVIFPLPEMGHLRPTLRVAQLLIKQGHRVVYLSTPEFQSTIALAGATLRSISASAPENLTLKEPRLWHQFGPKQSRSERVIRMLRECDDDLSVDLFLVDQHLLTSYRVRFHESLLRRRILFFSSSLPNWNEQRSELEGYTSIIFCPQSFEIPQFRRSSAALSYVEPSIFGLDSDSMRQRVPASLAPRVLATWGNQTARYNELLELTVRLKQVARRHPDVQFLLAGSCAGEEESLPNFEVHDVLDQINELCKTSVFLTHGGLGSVKESIACGVPLLVTPFLFDQPFNAFRVREHGLGEVLFPEEQSVEELESALMQLLERGPSPALNAMREEFLAVEADRPSEHLLHNALFKS